MGIPKRTILLTVDYYHFNEAKRRDSDYPQFCDECVVCPTWVIKQQYVADGIPPKTGYACGQHIDTILMKLANNIE